MQSSRAATTKSLSIKTRNLDFPDIGVVMELSNGEAIVELADGSLTYAYFTSAERDAMAKSAVKLQAGSVVNVAVQRNEARKIIQMPDDAGVVQSVKMFPIRIQEVQPVYLEKGSIVEIESEHAKVKLEKNGVVETVIFSASEKQVMQELNISFAIGQVVHVNVRKVAAYGRAIDIKEIGSPEPETVFLISPKAVKKEFSPEVVSQPVSDKRTVFSLLKEMNSPVATKKRETIVLNPARTLAIKLDEQVVSKPSQDHLPAVDKTVEEKEKKLLRRKRVVRPGNLLLDDPSAPTSSVVSLPQAAMQTIQSSEVKRGVSPAAGVDRKAALLIKLNNSSAMFPSINAVKRSSFLMPSIAGTKPVDNTANNELYHVLHDVILALKPLAKNKDDMVLMKNLSFITLSLMPTNKKLQLIIAEVKRHNLLNSSDLKPGFYAAARNTIPFNTIGGFSKLVASINLEKGDEKLLSQLKLMLPVRPLVSAFPPLKRSNSLTRF